MAVGRDAGRLFYSVAATAVDRVVQMRDKLGAPFAPGFVRQADDAFVPDDVVVYAVGDIHGRAELLSLLLDQISEDIKTNAEEKRPLIVFLGDYIDRGYESKAVLDTLCYWNHDAFEARFLKGNHEAAMLQFLSDPAFGADWKRYGGVETLVSYGVKPPRANADMEEWARVRDEFEALLPREHLNLLHLLELRATIGDYEFVHAGVHPDKDLDVQVEEDLLWIRKTFLKDNRRLERVIVHGHTPETSPYRDHRRVGVDTGAYLTGKLTAARFESNDVRFLSTS
ncbi:MAG: metallophosphoesterase [Pseudomonadota bacterium]